MNQNGQLTERILRLPEIKVGTGLSRSLICGKIKVGRFPEHKKLGEQMVSWYESQIASRTRDRLPIKNTTAAADIITASFGRRTPAGRNDRIERHCDTHLELEG